MFVKTNNFHPAFRFTLPDEKSEFVPATIGAKWQKLYFILTVLQGAETWLLNLTVAAAPAISAGL